MFYLTRVCKDTMMQMLTQKCNHRYVILQNSPAEGIDFLFDEPTCDFQIKVYADTRYLENRNNMDFPYELSEEMEEADASFSIAPFVTGIYPPHMTSNPTLYLEPSCAFCCDMSGLSNIHIAGSCGFSEEDITEWEDHNAHFVYDGSVNNPLVYFSDLSEEEIVEIIKFTFEPNVQQKNLFGQQTKLPEWVVNELTIWQRLANLQYTTNSPFLSIKSMQGEEYEEICRIQIRMGNVQR